MVVQGVKNPLVDLLSMEDKTLDEVRIPFNHIIVLRKHLIIKLSFSTF